MPVVTATPSPPGVTGRAHRTRGQRSVAERTIDIYGPLVARSPFGTSSTTDVGSLGVLAIIEDSPNGAVSKTFDANFIANVSHELKTPIGALGLMAEDVAVTNVTLPWPSTRRTNQQ